MKRPFALVVGLGLVVVVATTGLTAYVAGVPGAHGATLQRPAAKTKLSIMVGGLAKQIYLPNELAEKLGNFARNGLDVTLVDEPTGTDSVTATLAGQVQGGSGSYNHTIEVQALGKQMTEVVQLTIAPGEAEMVATNEAGTVKSFKDLRGKKLGVTELGSGTHTLSKYLLVHNKVPIDQVTFVPVGAGDTFIAAMQRGTIDAGMTTEPTISRLVQSNVGKVLVDLRTAKKTKQAMGGSYPFICVFMKSDYVKSHKATVQKLVNAYVETLKWIHTHTAAQIAAKLPADYYAGNKPLYLSALAAQKSMYSPKGMMPADGPSFVLKLEKTLGVVTSSTPINLSKTYTNSFVKAAK